MESRAIPDAQVTASSEWNSQHGASNGRLNFQAGGGRTGAWSAKSNDLNQWLQVDLGHVTEVTGIKTQGRSDNNQWVTSYTVSYSNDGINFATYKNVVRSGCKSVQMKQFVIKQTIKRLLLSVESHFATALVLHCYCKAMRF